MGLLGALADIISIPLRIAVDVVKLPGKIINSDDDFNVLENTTKGIKKIEEDLED